MLLGWSDPVSWPRHRILIAGCSGSGKSTAARQISVRLGVPYQELDALFHGPDWTARPEFVDDVTTTVARERWVVEYQYSQVRPLLLERADLLVWLDLPRWRVFSQLVRRTVARRRRRTTLWNGNVEPPLHTFLTDRDHIVRWAWRTYPKTARYVTDALDHRPDLPVVRLRSRREIAAWLNRLRHDC